MTEPTVPHWHTSTRSSNQAACVEVAGNLPGRVLVRDTKQRDGGTLAFAPAAWRAFLTDPPRRG
ncbi:DUF397 domain-containing protein [Plantactinospora sp. CA-290183]|uniref:DUF397 domain-containing protein n=1 Tax=Plantactinospora sp. CA-290183 TaxID=3240006 RepID=UPI003D8DE14F